MRPECLLASSRYRLALPSGALSGRIGSRLGRGTGSSLEFMDFRDYIPGDDLRHVDWRSYARTDQMKVRLFREEVSPQLEIVADLSPSMAVSPVKESSLRDLVEAVAEWGIRSGSHPRRLASGGGIFEDADRVPIGADSQGILSPLLPLRPKSLRLLVSDFLFPGDPFPEIRRFASGAAHVYVLQLLDPWELDPEEEGALSLIDCERDGRLDLDWNRGAREGYLKRLARLRDAVEKATRAVGGQYACVRAAEPGTMFRTDLLGQGIVEPVS